MIDELKDQRLTYMQETYEPLWEEMYNVLRAKAIPVRGFWMADSSAQGASGVLNENIQGDDGRISPAIFGLKALLT